AIDIDPRLNKLQNLPAQGDTVAGFSASIGQLGSYCPIIGGAGAN
ncbi:unnamed protein product, partial [Amoebophrya sp. A25]